MECLGISARGGGEAEFSEYFYHRGVFGQDFCRQLLQSGVACDLAAIAEKLACSVVDSLGHWTSWVGKKEQQDRSGRQMRPVPASGRLIWIKTIVRERPVAWRQHARSQMKARP